MFTTNAKIGLTGLKCRYVDLR